MSINRWKISDKMYDEILEGLSGKPVSERTHSFLERFPKLSKRRDKVFLDDKQLLTVSMLDKVLNQELMSGVCPMSCEGCWYYLRDKYCGAMSRLKVTDWIKSLESYQLERVRPRNPDKVKADYRRRREGATRFLLTRKTGGDRNALGADLMYISKHWSKWKYFLCVVHLMSGYCWFEPLSGRKAKDLITPFKRIVKDCEKRFDCTVRLLQTDAGTEFIGDFDDYLDSAGIQHSNEWKSYHSERKIGQFGRTFGRLLAKKVGFNEALVLAVAKLNNTRSRVTGMKPIEFKPNTKLKPSRVLRKGKRKATKDKEFEVGMTVRCLQKHADQLNTFYKSYAALTRKEKHENWSRETFKIVARKTISGEAKYRLAGERKWKKAFELQLVPDKTRKLTKPKQKLPLPAGSRRMLRAKAPKVRVDKDLKNIESDLGSYWKPVQGRRRVMAPKPKKTKPKRAKPKKAKPKRDILESDLGNYWKPVSGRRRRR